MNGPDSAGRLSRRPEILVAPLVTLGMILLLLAVARYYEHMPVRPAECGFKTLTGLPCVSCGGTRSMRALSTGQFTDAVRFNPGVVFGVACAVGWLGWRTSRYLRPEAPVREPRRASPWIAFGVILALLLANWIYLLAFPP